MTIYAQNKRARFDYEIIESLEAGIELKGHEVKAVKKGRINLSGAFAAPKNKEIFLLNADIEPYQPKNTPPGYNPNRSRRLLLNKKEIEYLLGKIKSERLTIVPIKVYNKRGFVKLELVLAKSKKKRDKRELIKKRETKREIARTLKK